MNARILLAVLTFAVSVNLRAARSDTYIDAGPELVAESGVTGGLIVHVGCGNGKVTAKLSVSERCIVHGLDDDAEDVERAREYIRLRGLYGAVSADLWDGRTLPYAENMVNLLIAESTVAADEVMRVLRPYGVAYVRAAGKWQRRVKQWPADIDEWTHWLHGPDGNAVAEDTVAGPPNGIKWIASPLWSRSHDSVPSVTSMVSAKGRLFYISDEAPASMAGSAPDKWALVGRDAFNGIELWRVPIEQWGWRSWATQSTVRFTIPTHMPRRLVAVGDSVYVTLGFNGALSELDAATGKVLREFEGTDFTDEILRAGGVLVVAINKGRQEPGEDEPVRKWVAAIDADSGKIRWKRGDYVGLRSKTGTMERISHLSMIAGGGRVYFVDGNDVVGLDMEDGTEVWRVRRPEVPEHKMRYNIRATDLCSTVYADSMVYLVQLNPDKRIDWREIRGRVHALSARTGREIWSRECSSWGWAHPADVFVIDGLVWVSGYKDDRYLGLDPKTGEAVRTVSNFEAFDYGHHHRCYRNKATTRYFMTGFRGIEFIDRASGDTAAHHWVRGTCRLGPVPCNGMIYATPHPCDCYISSKLNGFLGLLPDTDSASDSRAAPLEKGPAYGTVAAVERADADWPVYRRDTRRSGSTRVGVSVPLESVWRVNLGGEPTSPVVGAGRVVAAVKDRREVVALDRESGRVLWRNTVGGRVDSSPTIWGELLLFGCADGYVYCLRGRDGALVWRFRAAPDVRLITAFGRLESAWPVHGSVVIKEGTVYFTAGRSSFLDGGIWAWALDPETGKVVSSRRIESDRDAKVDWGRDQTADTGMLSDLLVVGADGVYMRQRAVFGQGTKQRVPRQLHATGGFLDDSWFHRTRWFLGGVGYAEYLVFDDDVVCGVRARRKIGGYGGHFAPGTEGYEVFAADFVQAKVPKAASKPAAATQNAGLRKGASDTPRIQIPPDRWSIRVPVRPRAMVMAGDKLIAAGHPDRIYERDAWAAYEGRRGGRLFVLSVAGGEKLMERELEAAPVFDGMAAAGGRIYLSTVDGGIECFGGRK